MEENYKQFIIKAIILVVAAFALRALFQAPVEYFDISLFEQTDYNRLFSKSDALKVISILGLFFAFYYQDRIKHIKHPKVNWIHTALYSAGAIICVAGYYGIRAFTNVNSITSGPALYLSWLVIALCLAGAFLLLCLAAFQTSYLKNFVKEFRKELMFLGITGLILYNLLILFQNQWPFFSGLVADILYFFFSQFYAIDYTLGDQAPILQINDFAVYIGAPCSGIESMLLFIAFCVGLFALDHKKIKKTPYAIACIVGFIGVYLVNVLRLILLILVGVHYSPELAVGLFHTNAGWVLFVIYFLCFYMVIRKFIYKGKVKE